MIPSSSAPVRPSAIAGTWYPASAPALRQTIEGYLDRVTPVTLPGPVLALVSPHAGYSYSGGTAAHAFAQVRDSGFRRVVLLGPLHRPIWGSRMGSFMVSTASAYRTPLGDVPLDREYIAGLGAQVPLTPVQRDEEHALEIELPFLQVTLGEFSLVPIMLGEHVGDPGARGRLDNLAAALAGLHDDATLLVASTDLSHLNDYEDVIRTDRRLVDLVGALDLAGLIAALQVGEAQACGAAGLVAILGAAQKLGARGARVLSHTTSGDVTGNKQPGQYTVGYLAAAVYR